MRTPIDRRDFLALGALAIMTPSASASESVSVSALAADGPPLYPGEVVDTHLHLWDLSRIKPPWINTATGRGKDVLAHDHTLADYAVASKGMNVTQAVYMEVDVAKADQMAEIQYISDLCASGKSPMIAAVISGRPASPEFAAHLDALKGNKYVKGLRQVLHTPATPPKFLLEPDFVKGVRMLGDRGLSFDLCLRNDQLESGAELVDLCPDTRFILDHCGNPQAGSLDLDGWRKGLEKMARTKNKRVMCKVSGLYANVNAAEWPAAKLAPIVRSVLDLFGPDRVMFAGDWPVVNLGASFKVWVETLKEIVRADPAENQAKLFRENARKFYGLP